MTVTEWPETQLPADLSTACGIVTECGDCDECCPDVDCDYDKVNGESSSDGSWLDEWCERCGIDLPGEPLVPCPVCTEPVPESCLEFCCRWQGSVTTATP